MKPSELFNREPVKIEYPFEEEIIYSLEPLVGCYYNHIPEFPLSTHDIKGFKKSDRIRIDYYKDHNYDVRRIWRLCSVLFDNEYVMIIQNAGREGDDYSERFIVDKTAYDNMIEHLCCISVLNTEDESSKCCVDIDKDIPSLDNFYGDSLDNKSERW